MSGIIPLLSDAVINVDTNSAFDLSARLRQINHEIINIDNDMNKLYWRVGLLGLYHLICADLLTSYNSRINDCAVYLDTIGREFAQAEMKINDKIAELGFASNAETAGNVEQYGSSVKPINNADELEYWTNNKGNVVADVYDTSKFFIHSAYGPVQGAKKGECTWWAYNRFYQDHGINLLDCGLIGNAGSWIANIPKDSAYYDVIQSSDVDVLKKNLKAGGIYEVPGHVLYIEYVEYDENGNPVRIVFTEANHRDKPDGEVQILTVDEFFNDPWKNPPLGLINPK